MRVGSFAVARPAYYDRNATSVRNRYNAAVAPAGFTTRWTATVGAGKKAYVDQAVAWINTSTLPTGSGYSRAYVETTDGTTGVVVCVAQMFTSTTAYTSDVDKATTSITLYAGFVITSLTADGSTGGTIQYLLDAQYTQFDA